MKRSRFYFSVAWVYLLAVLVMKLTECAGADVPEGLTRADLCVRAVTYNMLVVSWEILAGLLLSLLIGKFFPRVEKILCALYFSVLLLAETGLGMYASHNGYMLNCELWLRPFAETFMAVRAAMGLLLPLLLLLLLPAAVCLLSYLLRRFLPSRLWILLPVVGVFALLSVCFHPDHLIDRRASRYIRNKTGFLAVSSLQYLRDHAADEHADAMADRWTYRQDSIAEFLKYHPDWQVMDPRYPIERTAPSVDVLSPFFRESNEKPDVVILVVESLGDEFIANGFTPFMDSLAHQGLYWKNCLSTTSRSFGALPAITASAGGPKGFQFGRMPDCNSLIAVFNHNHYRTNAFYAGYFTFDCISEYLHAQHTGYYSPFWQQWKDSDRGEEGNEWGYHDGVLLRKTMEELRTRGQQPQFSLITTLTMHEGLKLKNTALQQKYMRQAKACDASAFSADITTTDRLASACYTDDALRDFFRQYSRLPRFRNTIFIITGDHASGLAKGEVLNRNYHVPLIIWSPLLTRHKTFSALVTHWDIAPSLQQLLKNSYGLKTPETVHGWGDGLDTSSAFVAGKDMLMVNYNREMQEIISGKYYYQMSNPYQPEQLYVIDSTLGLSVCKDDEALRQCSRKLDIYRYVFCYSYYADRTTAHPLFRRETFTSVVTYRLGKDLLFTSPSEPPSRKEPEVMALFSERALPHLEGFTKVRITLNAEVKIIDSIWQDKYPSIIFKYMGAEDFWCGESVAKFLQSEVLRKDSTYPLEMVKEFPLSQKKENVFLISISPRASDDYWEKEKKLLFRNAELKVEYAP